MENWLSQKLVLVADLGDDKTKKYTYNNIVEGATEDQLKNIALGIDSLVQGSVNDATVVATYAVPLI